MSAPWGIEFQHDGCFGRIDEGFKGVGSDIFVIQSGGGRK